MPKAQPPFDTQRYETLKTQGLSQRAIAEHMGMSEATLGNNLKVLAQAVAQALSEGLRMGDHGLPWKENADVSPSLSEVPCGGTPEDDHSTPPLYVHPGIPDDGEESPVGGEDIAEVHQSIPTLPLPGLQESAQGPLGATLSPELAEALTTAWPELLQMLQWWRMRQPAQASRAKLARTTWHVAPRWVEAVKCEADLTGESGAAVVNRALRQYFEGKAT